MIDVDVKYQRLFTQWLKDIAELHKAGTALVAKSAATMLTGTLDEFLLSIQDIDECTDLLMAVVADAARKFHKLVDDDKDIPKPKTELEKEEDILLELPPMVKKDNLSN